jgi:hypothetical protein
MADQAPTVKVPARLPVGWNIDTRDTTLNKDGLLINCYVEKDKATGVTSVYRRPGFSLWLHPTGFPLSFPSFGGGIYQGGGGFVYYTFGGVTYEYHNPTTPLINWGVQTTYIPVHYDSVMGGKPGTVVGNGADAYLIDLNQAVTGPFHTTDSDYPTFTSPGFSYLDGTLYVMQSTLTPTSGGAIIYGSAINSVDGPTSWDPLNFITAQMTPEGGIFLAKQLGYVVALKENSTEFFYDAGNATGSPLAPAENLYFSIGCADPNTVQRIGEILVWVGVTKDVRYQVVYMENTRPKVISTPAIERILNSIVIGDGTKHVYSWHLVTAGHTFYGLTLKDLNFTLVYDFNEDMWFQWTDKDGNYLPFVSVTGGSGVPFLAQHESNGSIYVWDSDYNADFIQEAKYGFTPFVGYSIPMTIRSPRWDGGTARTKQLSMTAFTGDIVPGRIITMQTSDDDYQTWSSPQSIDMGLPYPAFPGGGSFRRRAWRFLINDFLAPRCMQYMEIQVDIGSL